MNTIRAREKERNSFTVIAKMGRNGKRRKRQRQKPETKIEQECSNSAVPPSKKLELESAALSKNDQSASKSTLPNSSSEAQGTQEMDVETPSRQIAAIRKSTTVSHDNKLLNAANDLSAAIKKLSQIIPSQESLKKMPELMTLKK